MEECSSFFTCRYHLRLAEKKLWNQCPSQGSLFRNFTMCRKKNALPLYPLSSTPHHPSPCRHNSLAQDYIRHIIRSYIVVHLHNTADTGKGIEKRRTILHCWWGCKLVQPLWKSVWWFLRKLDIVLPEDPAIPLLGIYPNDAPTYRKDTCSTMFIAALFIITRRWKQPRCPST